MAELFSKHAVSLLSGRLSQTTVTLDLDPQTDWIEIVLERETATSLGVVWDASTTLGARIVVERDGESFVASGRSTGGIRTRNGADVAEYRLRYSLPAGYMGGTTGTRLGERALSTFMVRVELTLLRGVALTTTMVVNSEAAPLVLPLRHNSVAYDAQSSALENSGDGVISVSHTSTGDDRAALVAVSSRGTALDGTLTWTGGGETIGSELWSMSDIPGTAIVTKGYPVTNQATGAQTVTSDLTATSTTDHFIGVISMTGVNQVTPTGNVQTVTPAFDTQPSVTLTGMTELDLLVDQCMCSTSPTAGADQTQRVTETSFFPTHFRMSTQSGANGGVMSWTFAASAHRSLAAVVFKSAESVPSKTSLNPLTGWM